MPDQLVYFFYEGTIRYCRVCLICCVLRLTTKHKSMASEGVITSSGKFQITIAWGSLGNAKFSYSSLLFNLLNKP